MRSTHQGDGTESSFPVIDLRSADASAQIGKACAELGFFAVVNHGIDPTLTEAALDSARVFFSLPTETKMRVSFPEPGYPYGYSPYRHETLASSIGTEAPPDLKESFSVGPDCTGPIDHPLVDPDEAWVRSPSQWPDEVPDLKHRWTLLYIAMSGLSSRLLGFMAEALDLSCDYFEPMIDHHTSAMRAIHYPPAPDPGEIQPGALRASAHTDYGTLTILVTDGESGLEILDPSTQKWRGVPHVEGALIVNLGDSIAQWTNDRWRSTMHRVALPEDRTAPRYSMPFFHTANWEATIETLTTCLEEGEVPKHEPVKAGPWLMKKFTSTGSDS